MLIKPTLAQIASHRHWNHPRYRSCMAHWLFGEGGGLTAYDVSGYRNNGTLTNGPVWTGGPSGPTLSFDGTDDTVIVASPLTNPVGGLNAFSVAAWCKSGVSHPASTDDDIVTQYSPGGTTNKNFRLFKANVNDSFNFTVANATTEATIAANVADAGTAWRHVVGVWNGTIYLYVDGVLQTATATLAGPTNNASIPITIGGEDGSTLVWQGRIDDVRIYARALTQRDVSSLYNDQFLEFRMPAFRRYGTAPVGLSVGGLGLMGVGR